MTFLRWFIKLMKSEPFSIKEEKQSHQWIIDESDYIHGEEVEALTKTCNRFRLYGLKHKRFSQVRSWFMVELGLNAGLRVSEMASLKCGNLLIDKSSSSIFVLGKGNKKRAVWINSGFKKTCQIYLKYKKDFGYGIGSEDILLNNLKGSKISKRALQKFFKRALKKAGLPERYHIHNLRHTYTTFLLKASNYNYRFVQQQLGHASIKTTQVYAGVIEADGRKALEKIYT